MNKIKDRLIVLREKMIKEDIQTLLVPSNDFHGSEYIGEYFKSREYITGFTGTVGTALVTTHNAYLWVDGRYYIQAERQLSGTGIQLFKEGLKGVPSINKFLLESLSKSSSLAFDGRVVSTNEGKKLKEELCFKNISIKTNVDLIGEIWEGRPKLSRESIYKLEEKYHGQSINEKINKVRGKMKEYGASLHIITSLDDIAWLLNIRGNDVGYNQVVLSYCIVTKNEVLLFIQDGVIPHEIKSDFVRESIKIMAYDDIYDYVSKISKEESVLLDPSKVNYAIYNNIQKDVIIIERINPVVFLKSIKNIIEMKNVKEAHIKDGVAMTRFIYWIKHNVGKINITELSATDYLEDRRREQIGYLGPSFKTICAYKDNAALPHYTATLESNQQIKPEGFLLVDSGGQYYNGTTDITRTIALGALTNEEVFHNTLVLKGMIRLSKVKFRYGCTGQNLDYLARGPLWENYLDFNHGTGHGVGYLLNVHEAPNNIHWKPIKDAGLSYVFEEGMLTSNEPAYYVEGSHGVRIENLMLCRKSIEFSKIQFMEFDTVTMCPIDLESIEMSLMDEDELEWLNDYHEMVYQTISSRIPKVEAKWLREVTKRVFK